MYQQTIGSSFKLEGITIHSGIVTCMTLHPSRPNSGIVFRRTDVEPFEIIEAKVKNVSNTERCTQLTNHNGYSVSMVEHVMSALRGMAVDNAIIDINGEEIPVLDGSSLDIATKISEVGLSRQNVEKKYLRLKKNVRVEIGKSFLEAFPCSAMSYTIGFKNVHNLPFLSDQIAYFDFELNDYLSDIALARTFGYEKDINYLRSKELIKGASLGNAVLIGESGIMSNLRFQDEFARHKLLDVIGDLALIPPFLAKIKGERTSHHLNILLARKVLKHLY
ncbi:MAG: UDP-3-O-acyl-N-acetylglucosamine deacetylase [Bacillota bacterium]